MPFFVTRWVAFDDVHGQELPQQSERPSRDMDPLAHAAFNAVAQLCTGTSTEILRDMGLFIGTTLGSLQQDRRFDESRRQQDGRYASPAAFTRTLPSAVTSELTIRFGITGPTLVVSAGGASTLLALARACAWMRHIGLKNCLAGGLEWLGPGVSDETGSSSRDRCRGVLCILSQETSPEAKKIIAADIAPSTMRRTTHLDASMLQLINGLQSNSPQVITADSGDGMIVTLTFGDQ